MKANLCDGELVLKHSEPSVKLLPPSIANHKHLPTKISATNLQKHFISVEHSCHVF